MAEGNGKEEAIKQKVNVEIFEQMYTFRATPEDKEKVQAIAHHVDRMMHQVGDGQSKLDYRDIAVLAAMNIAEEYYQLQQDYQALLEMIDEEK